MAVTFQLPADLEDDLRSELRDLDAVAKEALLVSLYRQGKLSHAALSKALGLERGGAEDVLRKHGVNDTPADGGARIRKTPGVVGGDARVRDTRIPVWTLVELRKQGRTDDQLLEDFPGLTRDDLQAAWEYYGGHTAGARNGDGSRNRFGSRPALLSAAATNSSPAPPRGVRMQLSPGLVPSNPRLTAT